MPDYYPQTLKTVASLKPGNRIEVLHDVKVGFRQWTCRTEGTVVRVERRRHSLHFNRNWDDKVYSDVVVLKRESGDLTTITIDEYTQIRVLEASASS